MTIYGVDISEWQSDPDLSKLSTWLAGKPIEFFMLRTEDGNHKDGKFASYCMGLNSIDLYDLGTYFFFRAHLPMREQVLRAVSMHGDLPGPMACDMETLDGVDPMLAAERTLEALELSAQETGRTPLLYTDLGDWSKLGAWGKLPEFGKYPLWLAAVTEDPNRQTFVPPPWTAPVMRQYTFSRKVPGFIANVDGDVFLGSIEDWRSVGR